MKLSSCSRCNRLVRVESSSCPFCGTRLGTTSAWSRAMMTAVVGLSLTGCADKDGDETTTTSEGTSTTTTEGTSTTASTGATEGTSSTTQINTNSEVGGHSYDAAGDTYTGPGIPPDATETEGESSMGTTPTATGSSTTTGTGTTAGTTTTGTG